MEISKVRIGLLNGAVYNPRKSLKPGDVEYEKLKKSVEHFGYVDPIIVNKNGNVVVGGHQRLQVLKDLGYDEIDVVYVDLNQTDEKALNVALNKISGEWDAEKLEDLIRDLTLEPDFDVELTGFDMGEIDSLFNGAMDEVVDKRTPKIEILDDEVDAEEIEKIPTDKNERGIKLGDVFKLGRHTLMCGDSTNKDNVLKLIGDNKVELCMTDPPYPQDYDFGGLIRMDGSLKKYTGKGTLGKNKDEQLKNRDAIIDLSHFDVTKLSYLNDLDIPSFYIFTSKDGVKDLLNIFKDYRYDILTWCKSDPTPFKNNVFYPDIEYMLFFYKKGRTFNNNLTPPSIYKKYYISTKLQGIKDNGNEKVHPTMKPLELINNKMQISSSEGGVVLDLFGGSGSTLIVAEQIGRTCLMMEYEPKYMNVIIDRWEKFTGDKAVKVE